MKEVFWKPRGKNVTMRPMETELNWLQGMKFSSKTRHHEMCFDVSKDQGGEDSAPTPKEMLLSSVCACSGMDVVAIAKKMRLTLSGLRITASAEKSNTIPGYFTSVHVKYFIDGVDLDREKIIRLVALSMTKYCGVSYMISKVTEISYDINLNGELIHQDKANFTLEILP